MAFRADLHVHLGRTSSGRPVKIGASKFLTLEGSLDAALRKGIQLLGIVDFVPEIIEEALEHLSSGKCVESAGGGLLYRCGVLVVPGLEMEIRPEGRRPAHFVALFPDMGGIRHMSTWVGARQQNPHLSSQVLRATAEDALSASLEYGGTFWPAHSFTPHKGFYGGCAGSYHDVFSHGAAFTALELGLSADTEMADMLAEARSALLITASDCHGPETLAREFLLVQGQVSFEGIWSAARTGEAARWPVQANYGLEPRLGKYHRTACPECGWIAAGPAPAVGPCPVCGRTHLTTGVKDRIATLAKEQAPSSHSHARQPERPCYVYQVPLAFIPGVGPSLRARLRRAFGDESFVLHQATQDEIARVAGDRVAAYITAARSGNLVVSDGGGGQYGRVLGIRALEQVTSSS